MCLGKVFSAYIYVSSTYIGRLKTMKQGKIMAKAWQSTEVSSILRHGPEWDDR